MREEDIAQEIFTVNMAILAIYYLPALEEECGEVDILITEGTMLEEVKNV